MNTILLGFTSLLLVFFTASILTAFKTDRLFLMPIGNESEADAISRRHLNPYFKSTIIPFYAVLEQLRTYLLLIFGITISAAIMWTLRKSLDFRAGTVFFNTLFVFLSMSLLFLSASYFRNSAKLKINENERKSGLRLLMQLAILIQLLMVFLFKEFKPVSEFGSDATYLVGLAACMYCLVLQGLTRFLMKFHSKKNATQNKVTEEVSVSSYPEDGSMLGSLFGQFNRRLVATVSIATLISFIIPSSIQLAINAGGITTESAASMFSPPTIAVVGASVLGGFGLVSFWRLSVVVAPNIQTLALKFGSFFGPIGIIGGGILLALFSRNLPGESMIWVGGAWIAVMLSVLGVAGTRESCLDIERQDQRSRMAEWACALGAASALPLAIGFAIFNLDLQRIGIYIAGFSAAASVAYLLELKGYVGKA